MQHHSRSLKFASLLGFCGLVAVLTAPAQAQQSPPNFTTLSDVAGPFLGNVHTEAPPLNSPTGIRVSTFAIDATTRDLLSAPTQLNLGDVLKICVHLSTNLDTLAPFSGCADVNWRAYNSAVNDAKQLNRELLQAVRTQRTALGSNPSPEQRGVILQRLVLLEKTTTALESTTTALVALGEAMDKAR